uniref:Uncharacterized protein n=1 Tax=Romanomermis culicivorax TaxID=13658 RepID=A0A915JER8_ROMCU
MSAMADEAGGGCDSKFSGNGNGTMAGLPPRSRNLLAAAGFWSSIASSNRISSSTALTGFLSGVASYFIGWIVDWWSVLELAVNGIRSCLAVSVDGVLAPDN